MLPRIFSLLFAFLFPVLPVFSQYEFLQMPESGGEIQVVPAFNSCSFYYRPPDAKNFRVTYKSANETVWRSAHPTVCDVPEKIHKGSLFFLQEDTEYQIRILNGNSDDMVAQTTFRTLTGALRIAKTIDLSTLPNTVKDGIIITEQGTPDAWIKYTAPPGWVIKRTPRDADTMEGAIVLREAKYVILENLTVEGGKLHSILVENCDFVRILNCDLSGWGRIGVQQFINSERCGQYMDTEGNWIDYDGAILIRKSYGTVVERCYVHDPRGRSHPALFSHPAGPQAIVAEYTRGGNVIRWNDFVGSDEHRWNDVIECIHNSSPQGGLFRDSEIIGNYLTFGNDDGIEMEGGGLNLRFIGNKIEGVLDGISFGACRIGPQYAIGNLIVNLADEEGYTIVSLKNSHGVEQKGKRFIYNNTFHAVDRLAAAYTFYGPATPDNAALGTMRNNIFFCNDDYVPSEWARGENFDHDLFWVNRSLAETEKLVGAYRKYGQEKNAILADAQLVDPVSGNYRLASSSPARNKAVAVTGIIDAGDDLGAFFNGINDLPLRPLAFTASPAHVNFQPAGGASIVTLSLPANAAEPVTFQIRQNNVFDWFTVTPSNGTISPGKSLKLTVSADPVKLTGRPIFRGAFLVRTPNGLSRPITVYARTDYKEDKRPQSAPNTVYIKPESGVVDTQINIPNDGVYSLLVRVIPNAIRPRQDFDLKVNGEKFPTTAEQGYWYLVNGQERVLYLSSFGLLKAGPNHVFLKSIDPNIEIVEYIITDNPTVYFLQYKHRPTGVEASARFGGNF